MNVSELSAEQAADIRKRHDALRAFLGKRTSYHPDEVKHLNPPTNEELSSLEVHDFCENPPEKYFLYISQKVDTLGRRVATTWTGEKLGVAHLGKEWRDNFGGTRQAVIVQAVNGKTYHGTYFKSSGDFARIKLKK